MTTQLAVLYTTPAEPEAFDQHYASVHAPLVDKIPGLLRWETARIVASADGGDHTYYRIAILHFADQAGLQAALSSAEGEAAAADYQAIAAPGSRMYIAAGE